MASVFMYFKKKNPDGDTRKRPCNEWKNLLPVQVPAELEKQNDRYQESIQGSQRNDCFDVEHDCQQRQGKEDGSETGKALSETRQEGDERDDEIWSHEANFPEESHTEVRSG